MTPACPCCGKRDQWGRDPLCAICWAKVPGKAKATVLRTQKALGYNPASLKVQSAYKDALHDAIAAIP